MVSIEANKEIPQLVWLEALDKDKLFSLLIIKMVTSVKKKKNCLQSVHKILVNGTNFIGRSNPNSKKYFRFLILKIQFIGSKIISSLSNTRTEKKYFLYHFCNRK